jgi:hypothetical protein
VTVIGFDYTERIAPAALKSAGCSVVFRYLSQPGWSKNITRAEADELLAAGLPIVLNYETSGTFMLGGYSAGQSAARSARAQANALGAPTNTRIYYSADFNATADQIPTILEFDRGAASVDGNAEVGGYGGLKVALAEDATGFSTWQTIAWSDGQWDARSLARQTGVQQTVGGVVVDVNQIENLAALGAWMPSNSDPAPIPAQPSTTSTDPEDDNMPAFATGVIEPGADAVTVVLPPPANYGSAGWGDVWFSLGAEFGTTHVRVAIFTHGQGWSHIYEDVVVDAATDRVNPFGGPLPTGVQKISVKRVTNPDVPLAYLVEAVHR